MLLHTLKRIFVASRPMLLHTLKRIFVASRPMFLSRQFFDTTFRTARIEVHIRRRRYRIG